jgi:hypothetical protein
MQDQFRLDLPKPPSTDKDIYLCHNGADKPWVELLAERIEAERYLNRNLTVVFDKWDFKKGSNIVLDIDEFIDRCRFVGVVVSRAMLNAEWPTLERSVAVWSDPSGRLERVIPLMRENVTLPATLRVRNWIDFRDDDKFEESFRELIYRLRGEAVPRGRGSLFPSVPLAKQPYEPVPTLITASTGADRVSERLVSNLYRVLSLPQGVYHADTKLREKKDIHEYYEDAPPFILRDGRLYTFADMRVLDGFRSVLKRTDSTIASEDFGDWFSDDEYRRRAIELLNVYLKKHAWKRHLRFDGSKGRYFFSPPHGMPKRVAWNIGGRRRWREVTTRHTRREKQQDGSFKDVDFGWRHQGVRANFMFVFDSVMLKLEPTYLLTKEDGKTPQSSRWVGPVLSHWLNQERNGQILRSLRFWSLVLARGKELVIETGQSPIRVDLTPIAGSLDFGIASDRMDFDALMNTEIEDDLQVPQLELFGEETSIARTEEVQFAEEDREPEEK